MIAGAIIQIVTNLKEPTSARSKTVVVEFRADGNALHDDVSWTAPDGTRTYTGELPLMNTKGTQGVAYEMPAGSPVRIKVTNKAVREALILASPAASPAASGSTGYP